MSPGGTNSASQAQITCSFAHTVGPLRACRYGDYRAVLCIGASEPWTHGA